MADELYQIRKRLASIESLLLTLTQPEPTKDMYVTAQEFRRLYPMTHSKLEDNAKRKKLLDRKRANPNSETSHWVYNVTAWQRYLKSLGQKIAA
jgi:hypothetical protein